MLILTIISGVFVLSLVPWMGLLVPTAMLTDAPGSTKLPGVRLALGSCFTYPVVVVVAELAAWALSGMGQPTLAVIAALAPLINLALAGLAAYLLWGRTW